MARIGYIMVPSHYDYLNEDVKWMEKFGCVRILKEKDFNETTRPVWKQLLLTLSYGDELVISKFSNAVRGTRELSVFLEFCRVKKIRLISIHDKIDSADKVFPIVKTSDLLEMVASLPKEVIALRKTSVHHKELLEKIKTDDTKTEIKLKQLERERSIVNMYLSGHSIEDIWKISGYKSRSSIFRILNKYDVVLDRGSHSGPLK